MLSLRGRYRLAWAPTAACQCWTAPYAFSSRSPRYSSGLIELDTASWTVREVQLCRSCRKIESRQLYLTVVSDVPAIQRCDPRGLVDIDTRIADH
jgi:hypothetical protein